MKQAMLCFDAAQPPAAASVARPLAVVSAAVAPVHTFFILTFYTIPFLHLRFFVR